MDKINNPRIPTNLIRMVTKLVLFVAISIFLFVTIRGLPAEGAELFFSPNSQRFGVGQTFEAEIFLDTQKEDINAIEGTIVFPEDILALKEIRDGETIINLWIQRPKEQEEISFAGIIPGGYTGQKGKIFSLVFQTKKEGEGDLIFQTAKVLLNDGKGTAASLTLKHSHYQVSEALPLFQPEVKIDKESPEPFQPEISRSPEVFNGKYFLIFSTQDKISGIAYYEVKEGRRQFVKAESPYLLRNQWLYEEIIVRVVDKAGNMREARIAPLKTRPIFFTFKFWLVVFGIGFVIYVIWRLLKKKFRK